MWFDVILAVLIFPIEPSLKTQCADSAIFLPLWFYLKSILTDLKWSKTAILIISGTKNFDFWEFLTLKCQEFSKVKFSNLLKWSKFQFFRLQNDKNWFHVKCEWQWNPVILILYIGNFFLPLESISHKFCQNFCSFIKSFGNFVNVSYLV